MSIPAKFDIQNNSDDIFNESVVPKEIVVSRDDGFVTNDATIVFKDQSKREAKSCSDIELDFDVLEIKSTRLNLSVIKEKGLLCKRACLGRNSRKLPRRRFLSVPEYNFFQDSTECKSRSLLDSSSKEVISVDGLLEEEPDSSHATGDQKGSSPVRPIVMPDLRDLSQYRLFEKGKKQLEDVITSLSTPLSSSDVVPAESMTISNSPVQTNCAQSMKTNAMCLTPELHMERSALIESSAIDGVDHPVSPQESSSLPDIDLTAIEESGVKAQVREPECSVDVHSAETTSPSVSFMAPYSPAVVVSSRANIISAMEGHKTGDGGQIGKQRIRFKGLAYTAIGFRPRRNSSIVFGSNERPKDHGNVLSTTESCPGRKSSLQPNILLHSTVTSLQPTTAFCKSEIRSRLCDDETLSGAFSSSSVSQLPDRLPSPHVPVAGKPAPELSASDSVSTSKEATGLYDVKSGLKDSWAHSHTDRGQVTKEAEETPYSMTNYKAAGLKTKPPIPLPKPPRSVLTMSDKNRPMSAKNSPAISRDIAKLKRHLASTNEQSNVLNVQVDIKVQKPLKKTSNGDNPLSVTATPRFRKNTIPSIKHDADGMKTDRRDVPEWVKKAEERRCRSGSENIYDGGGS